jgi:subtilisin family serine protease
MVELLVRCVSKQAVNDLRTAGMTVRFVVDGCSYTIVSGKATLNILEALNDLPSVERIESSREIVEHLDISSAEIRTDVVRSRSSKPLKGAGVIVGIIDGGIDYTHPDFQNQDGTSRILFLWDHGGQSTDNTKVPYGREYTKAELDAALASQNPLQEVPHQDEGGHGTHVTGIAAGNGSASAGKFTGVAPEADLIVVALQTEKGRTLGRSVRAFEAFAYIVEKAGKSPVAINFSQGMNGGGHSGETVLETGLDNLMLQPNVVVVKSSGNEQVWRIHAGGQVQQGQILTLELSAGKDNNKENDILELWYSSPDQISVAVQPPSGTALDFVKPGDQKDFDTGVGNRVSIDFDPNANGTEDMCATVILSKGSVSFIQPGTWKLLLRGDRVEKGRYDVWIERSSGRRQLEQLQFSETSADPTCTITVPGTSKRIITVGSYVTRPHESDSPPRGEISQFSSVGATRYGVQKPEISAPGEWIISTLSSQKTIFPGSPQLVPGTTKYWADAGTSMAAPQVTGTVALILSVRPNLTCEQVKQILMQTSRRDGFASKAPDNTWGSGKLDVEAAVKCAESVRFPKISNVQVDGVKLSWQTDIPTTSAVRFNTNQRQLQLGKKLDSIAALTLSNDHIITLTNLSTGKYFCEILAFSEENWWTIDDNGGALYLLQVS